MARSEKQICWVVAHPEIGTAFVTADSWEQATVAAAKVLLSAELRKLGRKG